MATNDRKANTRPSRLDKVAKRMAGRVAKLPKARKVAVLSELGDMAEIIKAEVKAQGISARALAQQAEVPQPTVTRFLNGADLRISTASKICRVLGLKLVKST